MPEENQTRQTQLQPEDHGKPIAEWSFPEFIQHERSRVWYIWALVVVAALLVYAVWSSNFLFALIVLMVVVVYYIHIIRTPEEVAFTIYEDGIQMGHRFSKWRDIKSFWILYEPTEVKKLYFEFKARFRPFLSVPLEKQNPVELRNILKKHLEEDLLQEEEPASEQWEKFFKL